MSASTLVDDVRAELAAIAPTRRCDRLAEISALFHTAGAVHLRGRGSVSFHLDLASSAAVRRAFALLGELRVPAEIRTYTAQSFGRATRYQLHVEGSESALGVLAEAGVVGDDHLPLDRPPGIGSKAGLCGISHTWPRVRLNVFTVASPSIIAATISPLSATFC